MAKKPVHDATGAPRGSGDTKSLPPGQSSPASRTKPKTRRKPVRPGLAREPDGQFSPGNTNVWQPGQSGNPAGRPKCKTLSEAIRAELARPFGNSSEDLDRQSWAEIIAARLVRVAAGFTTEVSTNACKEIADRTEGKARQPIDLDPLADARTLLAGLLGCTIDQLPDPRS